MNPEAVPCVWEGHYAVMTGPFLSVCDDDHHIYRCGEPMEICSRTFQVLRTQSYQPYFTIINRASVGTASDPVICGPSTGCC
jgi:arsenite methyltransferase